MWLWCVPALLGLLAGAVAVIYFTVPAESLPTVLGRVPAEAAHRVGPGEVAAALAIGLLLTACVLLIGTHLRRHATAVWRMLLGR